MHMRRRSAPFALVLGCLVLGPSAVLAQGTSCANATYVPADGRINGGAALTTGTYYFRVPTTSGNSYSFEVADTVTPLTASAGALSLAVFSDTGCSTSLTARDTKAVDPGVGAFNARVSWTAASAQTMVVVTVPAATSVTATWTANDTTLYSPSWSTNGTYNTYYSFKNTTGAALTGTLMQFDTNGNAVTTTSLSVPARGTAAVNTVSLGTPRDLGGTASFVHNGPPGAILAEADVANFTLTPPYIQPVKFQPTREIR